MADPLVLTSNLDAPNWIQAIGDDVVPDGGDDKTSASRRPHPESPADIFTDLILRSAEGASRRMFRMFLETPGASFETPACAGSSG